MLLFVSFLLAIVATPTDGSSTAGPKQPATGSSVKHKSISGIYPHLAMWNNNGECGVGGVYPWAGKLWVITYSPHFPKGSDDKLYSIDPSLKMEIFPDSVGGTPANRMVHKESGQLVIGPYFIDQRGTVRVISPKNMLGRHTGNARHLQDPANKIYCATMEEGIYEIDVNTLNVKTLFADYQQQTGHEKSDGITESTPLMNMPGYHGKGLYSGQGRLIYANNGEASSDAKRDPTTPSGCLAQWDGVSQKWDLIRRNQFVDVRGPGGLYGNENPQTDPIWAIGWDYRSLILMLLDKGNWHTYRLPKASHTYDGAHGWNTEWPRFNDLGGENMVLNMHGMFWDFPKSFSHENSTGIRPRSTYLKVIGDYCRWGDRIVFGCDDTAKNEFLNKRRAKGKLKEPGQSHSNLWFTDDKIFDRLGSPIGRGAVWVKDEVEAHKPSDPFLFSGFRHRMLCLTNHSEKKNDILIELDTKGNGEFSTTKTVILEPKQTVWHSFDPKQAGHWLQLRPLSDGKVSAVFQYRNEDSRDNPSEIFAGLADTNSESVVGGVVRVRGANKRSLALVSQRANKADVSEPAFYELDGQLNLVRVDDQEALQWTMEQTATTEDVLQFDNASAIYVDDDGNRWRLPKNDRAFDSPGLLGTERVDREVVTERDLFNCHGTFYELPARNAGGIAKIRPVCTHNLRIKDYCSYRGLLVLTGIESKMLDKPNEHIIVSDDGQAALWLGVVDDLWKLGKPTGIGGPWFETEVKKGQPSDAYLLTGYDKKKIKLSQNGLDSVEFDLEVDITGTGHWVSYKSFTIADGKEIEFAFPDDFAGYWLRVTSSADTNATAMLEYN